MPNNRHILMVTYFGDVKLAGYSLLALDKFLIEPSIIQLYINEPGQVMYDECAEYLAGIVKSFKNHQVVIHSRREILKFNQLLGNNKQGYVSQQLIKLFAKIDQYYLIIDPKDILINPIRSSDLFINHWPYRAKQDTLTEPFVQFCNKLESIYGHRKKLRGCLTPYMIDSAITKQILLKHNGSIEQFGQWFGTFNSPSEFFLYDYAEKFYTDCVTESDNLSNLKILYFRCSAQFDLALLQEFLLSPDNSMIKIHANSLVGENYREFEQVIKQLF
jgi:hypothetical protein